MLTRRQFVTTGGVLPVVLPLLASASTTANRPGSPFVVDLRFEAARIAARRARIAGLTVVPLARDAWQTWRQHLLPGLGQHPKAIAGVTTEKGLFLLQTLAADQRWRVLQSSPLPADAAQGEALVAWHLGPGTGMRHV